MTGPPASDVKAVAGLAAHHVLALEHDAGHVAQGGLEVIGILLLDLLLGDQVELGAVAGGDRRCRIIIRCLDDGHVLQYDLFFCLPFLIRKSGRYAECQN